jgi:preprotein translocase subunit YajC
MFISDAFAQAASAAQQGSAVSTVVQLVLIFVIFYFLLIRPQQKKVKKHEAMLLTVKRGDKILTGGGIIAVVEKVVGEEVETTIADGVTVKILRSSIRDIISEIPAKEEKDTVNNNAKADKKSKQKNNKR